MPEELSGMFRVMIKTGNDAMQAGEHLASALRIVADRLEEGRLSGGIKDENGNTVGRYEFKPWSETAVYDRRRNG